MTSPMSPIIMENPLMNMELALVETLLTDFLSKKSEIHILDIYLSNVM